MDGYYFLKGSYRWSFVLMTAVLASQSVRAQSDSESRVLSLAGIVKDSINGTPLEDVNVYLYDSPVGTVTNSAGEFVLKIPVSQREPSVLFSMIGYKTKLVKLGAVSDSLKVIVLSAALYRLTEVVVSANSTDSGKYIVNEAIRRIKFNYPHKPHLMEGFFRELTICDTAYTRLIEAAIRVQEVGYNKNTFNDDDLEMTGNRIKVIELRKSEDYRTTDLMSKAMSMLFGNRNELYSLWKYNYVRVLGKNSHHGLSKGNIARYDVSYSGISEWEHSPVYIVVLETPADAGFHHTEYTFYINKADFAILKIEVKASPGDRHTEVKPAWLIDRKFFMTAEIRFRKIDGKYYPFFIRTRHFPNDASGIFEAGSKTIVQYVDVLFLLTNVYPESFSKIKWKNAEERDKKLYESKAVYHKEFWDNYNVVKRNPLKGGAGELERNKTLQQQFEKN